MEIFETIYDCLCLETTLFLNLQEKTKSRAKEKDVKQKFRINIICEEIVSSANQRLYMTNAVT